MLPHIPLNDFAQLEACLIWILQVWCENKENCYFIFQQFVEILQLFRIYFWNLGSLCCFLILLETFQSSENMIDTVKEIFIVYG